MAGKLILITGFFGAGKTTLLRYAVKHIDNLEFIETYTTRPRRSYEPDEYPYEYVFVSDKEYKRHKDQAGERWDELANLKGGLYGSDINKTDELLLNGVSMTHCIMPDLPTLDQYRSQYKVTPYIIWIDTPLAVSNSRLLASKDEDRMKRVNHRSQNEEQAQIVKTEVDGIYTPVEGIGVDCDRFLEYAIKILQSNP